MAEPGKAEPGKDAAVIGEEASFSGRFTGKDLVLLGRLEGEIELRGRLRLGPKAHARANVRAAAVDAEGQLEGEVRADAMNVTPTARVRGTFVVKRLSVQEGALVEGSINPASARQAEPPPAPRPPASSPYPPLYPSPTPAPPAAPAPAAGPNPAAVKPAPTGPPAERKPEDDGPI